MNWENVDTQLVQLYSQLLMMERQLMLFPPQDMDVSKFMAALIDFINLVGSEMQRQAV